MVGDKTHVHLIHRVDIGVTDPYNSKKGSGSRPGIIKLINILNKFFLKKNKKLFLRMTICLPLKNQDPKVAVFGILIPLSIFR